MKGKYLARFIVTISLTASTTHIQAQEFFGKWTLDWSEATKELGDSSSEIAESFMTESLTIENNPVWILSEDSLKVYQNEQLLSGAEINWVKEDQFEILAEDNRNEPYYIRRVDAERIRMRSKSSDAELLLKKL